MKLTDKQKRDAFRTGVAPAGTKFLVMATNTDGRMCLFARGDKLADVKTWVDEHWTTHGGSGCMCYEGEQRGLDEVMLTDDAPLPESKVLYNPMEGL